MNRKMVGWMVEWMKEKNISRQEGMVQIKHHNSP